MTEENKIRKPIDAVIDLLEKMIAQSGRVLEGMSGQSDEMIELFEKIIPGMSQNVDLIKHLFKRVEELERKVLYLMKEVESS